MRDYKLLTEALYNRIDEEARKKLIEQKKGDGIMKYQIKVINPSKEERERFEKEAIRNCSSGKYPKGILRKSEAPKLIVDKDCFYKVIIEE